MARHRSIAPAGNGSAPTAEPGPNDAPGAQGVDAARGWMGTWLASLTEVATWLEQLQALNSSALAGWNQALALCARDLEQARDAEQFMALPAQMFKHQLEQTSLQLGKAMQDLFDAQASWAEPWRRQFGEAWPQAAAPATEEAAAEGRQPPALPAAIGQFQDQWLDVTRKWIDAMGAAAAARNGTS